MARLPLRRGGLLTTAEAAELLQISTATLKRWAVAGLIAPERTAGGHRRFRMEDVRALLPPSSTSDDQASSAAELLLAADRPLETQSWLERRWRQRGSWWGVTTEVRAVTAELYRRQTAGAVTAVEVESTLDRLRSAALRFLDTAPVPSEGPTLLVALVPGDPYALASALILLCAAESGWRARWAGHPKMVDLAEELSRRPVQALVVQRSVATPPEVVRRYATQLQLLARTTGLPVCVVGMGDWPERAGPVATLDSVASLRTWLEAVGLSAGRAVLPPAAHADGVAEDRPAPGWGPALKTGHATIDSHHRALFANVARLAHAARGEGPPTSAEELVRFIGDYAEAHFRLEENVMRESGYPDESEHHREHEHFRQRLTLLEREFEAAGRTPASLQPLADYLQGWLREHVAGSDRRLGLHLRRGGAPRT